MSHEKYWDYLDDLSRGLIQYLVKKENGRLPQPSEYYAWLKLTASPYYHWLENQAVLAPKPPKESSDGKSTQDRAQDVKSGSVAESHSEDSSNLANKAQEIREKARTSIKEYMKTNEAQWPSDATTALMRLAADWAAGQTVYRALDSIPDLELCRWNDRHKVFE